VVQLRTCFVKSLLAVAGIALACAFAASPTMAADPQPFVTVSAACNPQDPFVRTPPQPDAHPNVVARLELSGLADAAYSRFAIDWNYPRHIYGNEVVWEPPDQGLGVGSSYSWYLTCGTGSYTLQLFDVPMTPTSFTGTTGYGDSSWEPGNGSTLAYRAPAGAPYVADVTLMQGAIRLKPAFGFGTVVSSSGSYDLGVQDAGLHQLSVEPVDGPRARWTIRVRAVPVTISGTKFDRLAAKPGVSLTASYALTSDSTVSANVVAANGALIRNLGSGFPAARGQRSLRWDGLDELGRPVPSGVYELRLSAVDVPGNTASGVASVLIDGTRPQVTVLSPRILPRRRGLVVRTTDLHSDLRKATLYVDKRAVAIRRSAGSLTFRPPWGWRPGPHLLRVIASDSVGNVVDVTRAFRVRR
jgi:FlgD Ig-like domain